MDTEVRTQDAPLHIVELRAENFKRLRIVHVKLEDGVVVISGRNGQGKSSFLDAIFALLAGGKAIPSEPIRRGAPKATIACKLARGEEVELVVELVLTQGGKKLTVKKGSGQTLGTPQEILDAVLGKLSFDPSAFLRLPESKQREMLIEVSGLDLDKLQGERDAAYAQRTDAGRELKRLEGAVDSMPAATVPRDAPEPSLSALTGQLQQAVLKHEAYTDDLRSYQRQRDELDQLGDRILQLKSKLEELQRQQKELAQAVQVQKAELEEVEAELPDRDAIQEQISSVEAQSTAWRASQAYYKAADELDKAREAYNALDRTVKTCEARKENALAAAKMPIEGLRLTDDGLTYKGLPLKQASSAEQIRVCMAIAMALNPDLRIVLIREGSLLDDQSLAIVAEMATASGYQVIVERVGSQGESGFVIEDGLVIEGEGRVETAGGSDGPN